jgi:hypothetical protein
MAGDGLRARVVIFAGVAVYMTVTEQMWLKF